MSDRMISDLLSKTEEYYNDDIDDDFDSESVSSQYLRKKVQIAREKIEETVKK